MTDLSIYLFAASPEKMLFEGEVASISLNGGEGYMEVLPNHAAILSLVNTGKVILLTKGQEKIEIEVNAGFFQLKENNASLLCY